MDLDSGPDGKDLAQPARPLKTGLYILISALLMFAFCEIAIIILGHAGCPMLEIYGTGNHDLEFRLNHLSRFRLENGQARYLFIGNSKVGQGIDEEVLRASYEELTGAQPSAVNFGFGGNTVEFLPIIVRILEEDYKPGRFAIDTAGPYQSGTFNFMDSQWIRFRTEDFNLGGWMVDNFHFMRVFLRLRYWMEQPREDYQFRAAVRDLGRVRDIGFTDRRRARLLKREEEARHDPLVFEAFPSKVSADSLAEEQAFDRIIREIGAENLVLFELPLSFRVTKNLADYGYRKARSDDLSEDHGIPVLRIPDPRMLPLESWMRDGLHMEVPGIEAYSSWLGKALADLEDTREGSPGSKLFGESPR